MGRALSIYTGVARWPTVDIPLQIPVVNYILQLPEVWHRLLVEGRNSYNLLVVDVLSNGIPVTRWLTNDTPLNFPVSKISANCPKAGTEFW